VTHEADVRAAAILGECLAIRLAGRAIAIGAAAWSHSATRRLMTITGDRKRFWLVAAVTALAVAIIGTGLGAAR
jgi:hypothetical protein